MALPGEFGRVQHDRPESLAGGSQGIERLKTVAGLEADVRHAVDFRIRPGQRECFLAAVHCEHFLGAAESQGT